MNRRTVLTFVVFVLCSLAVTALQACSAEQRRAADAVIQKTEDASGVACAALVEGATCSPIPEHPEQMLCTFLEGNKLHPFTVLVGDAQ